MRYYFFNAEQEKDLARKGYIRRPNAPYLYTHENGTGVLTTESGRALHLARRHDGQWAPGRVTTLEEFLATTPA